MGADLASPVYGAVITPGEWDGSPLLSSPEEPLINRERGQMRSTRSSGWCSHWAAGKEDFSLTIGPFEKPT